MQIYQSVVTCECIRISVIDMNIPRVIPNFRLPPVETKAVKSGFHLAYYTSVENEKIHINIFLNILKITT